MTLKWTQAEAIALCTEIESICPAFNCHVALTGGLLYKSGERKDCDILFYSIRGKELDKDSLFEALKSIGLTDRVDFGFCNKLKYRGKGVDAFFPEEPVRDDDYQEKRGEDPDDARDRAIDDKYLESMFADPVGEFE